MFRRAPSDRTGPWALAALLLLAWLLHWRTFGLQELGQDGYLSADLGAGSLGGMLTFISRDVHPPLFFALLHGLFWAGGVKYPVAKFLPIAAAQIALPVMFFLARRLAGTAVAWWSTVLLLLSVPMLLLAPTVRPFTLGLLGSSLSLLLMVRLLQTSAHRTRRHAVSLALVTAAALLSWYLQVFVLAVEAFAIWRAPARRQADRVAAAKVRRAGLAALGAGALLAAPWYGFVLPGVLAKLQRGATVTEGTPGMPSPGAILAGLAQALMGRAAGDLAIAGLLGWAVLLALGIWCCLCPERRSSRQISPGQTDATCHDKAGARRSLLLTGLLLGALEIGAILLRWQHPDAAGRYLLGLLPFALILQALALTSRRPAIRLPALLGVALAVAGQLSWYSALLAIPPNNYEGDPESDFLVAHLQPGDAVLFSDHGREGQFLLNRRFAGTHPTAVAQTSGDSYLGDTPAQAVRAVASLVPRARRIWYEETEPRPGRAPLGQQALAARTYLADQAHAGGSDIELFLTRAPDTRRDIGQTFGGAVTLQSAAFTSHAMPGGAVTVELVWRDDRPLDAAYSVFVHLDNATGKLVAQHDGQPETGLAPTDRWQPGLAIVDRHGLVIPVSLPAGTYALHVGMYRIDGRRLTLPDGENQVEIGTVQVGG